MNNIKKLLLSSNYEDNRLGMVFLAKHLGDSGYKCRRSRCMKEYPMHCTWGTNNTGMIIVEYKNIMLNVGKYEVVIGARKGKHQGYIEAGWSNIDKIILDDE